MLAPRWILVVALLEVVAPADLPEGYELQARDAHGALVTVKVPPGGVEQGQKFTVATQPPQIAAGSAIPVGQWRDSLWGLLNYGLCHPHVWTACCCATSTCGVLL